MKGSASCGACGARRGPSSFWGRYTNFREMLFEPKPARRGGPPIWVGGMTDPSLRRVARMADGWLPWAVSKEELEEGASKISGMSGGWKSNGGGFGVAVLGMA